MNGVADRFTAVLDTNVLVGALTRNIILSLAEAGLFRPRWSVETIEDEFERVFRRLYPDKESVGPRQRANIERAFPEAAVLAPAALIGSLLLPDAGDRHVLAAAIMTKATVIVTDNLRDFPASILAPFQIEALSADHFIADCIDFCRSEALPALRGMRVRLRNPAMTAEALIQRMEHQGLVQTANLLSSWKGLL